MGGGGGFMKNRYRATGGDCLKGGGRGLEHSANLRGRGLARKRGEMCLRGLVPQCTL